MSRLCKVYNFTKYLSEYESIWRLQKHLQNECWETKKAGRPTWDCLILVQHPHVFTLGRGATLDNVLLSEHDNHLPLFRVERGGEVTYHGPGQIIAYPIFDLDMHKRDLHWFSRSLEQTVIETLKKYGLQGERSDLNAGVWIGNKKISAQGITASRWITIHGVSLNVSTDMSYYKKIVPCGLDSSIAGVCSISSISQSSNVTPEAVANDWLSSFSSIFNLSMENVEDPQKVVSNLQTSELLQRLDHPKR